MKFKTKSIFLLLLSTISIHSQNVFPTTSGSNVGIGTTAPSTRLQITSGTSGTSGLRLTNLTSTTATSTGNGKALSVDASGNIVLASVLNTAPVVNNVYTNDGILTTNRTVTMTGKNFTLNPTQTNSQFFIDGTTGNVGLGTVLPSGKLEVKGDVRANQGVFTSNQVNGTVYGADISEKCTVLSAGTNQGPGAGYPNGRMLSFIDYPSPTAGTNTGSRFWFGIEDRNDFGRFRMTATTGGVTYFGVLDKSQQDVFAVNDNGNDNIVVTMPKTNSFLGIGTSNFTDVTGTYKLSVAGNIRANRVRVYTDWADFVFESKYKLPSLENVELQIKQNGHLSNIPSAKDVSKNGIELGEMNKLSEVFN